MEEELLIPMDLAMHLNKQAHLKNISADSEASLLIALGFMESANHSGFVLGGKWYQ